MKTLSSPSQEVDGLAGELPGLRVASSSWGPRAGSLNRWRVVSRLLEGHEKGYL